MKMRTICPECGREINLLGDAAHVMSWQECGFECSSLTVTCSALSRLSRFRRFLQRWWPW